MHVRFDIIALSRKHLATTGAAVLITVFAGAAWPQAPGIQTPAGQAAPAPPPVLQQAEPAPPANAPQEENPGLLHEMEKLLEKSMSIFPTLKSPRETLEDWNARAKGATQDAGENLSRLAKPSTIVKGRAVCPVASNGAPDCKAGADKLCQANGFKEGKSLDTDAAEKCSSKVYLPGHKREPGDCRTENYVIRALCQ